MPSRLGEGILVVARLANAGTLGGRLGEDQIREGWGEGSNVEQISLKGWHFCG